MKYGGVLLSTPEGGRERERGTLQCVHCQYVWLPSPGSGRRRGFCTRCAGVTCGKGSCGPCVHFLKRIEAWEKGVSVEQLPIMGRVEAEPPRGVVPG